MINLRLKSKLYYKQNEKTGMQDVLYKIGVQVKDGDKTINYNKFHYEFVEIEKTLQFYPNYKSNLMKNYVSQKNELENIENFLKKLQKEDFFHDKDVYDFLKIDKKYQELMYVTADEKSLKSQTTTTMMKRESFCYYPYFNVQITDVFIDEQKNFTQYVIQFYQVKDPSKVFKTIKRYSDFWELDHQLKKVFKEKQLPALPSKNIFQSDPIARKNLLQDYLQTIFNTPMYFDLEYIFNFFGYPKINPNKIQPISLPMQTYKAKYVSRQKTIDTFARPYTSYIIQIYAQDFQLYIVKRYNNFCQLHENLERLGVNVPTLPKKRKERREIELVEWLNKIFFLERIEENFCFRKFIFDTPDNLRKLIKQDSRQISNELIEESNVEVQEEDEDGLQRCSLDSQKIKNLGESEIVNTVKDFRLNIY